MQFLGILVASAVIVFASATARAFFIAPSEDLEVALPASLQRAEPVEDPSWPTQLLIPSLKLDTSVQWTGITKRGTMAVPLSYNEAGWYRYGTVPGARGSAVMAGHVDGGGGFPAVFNSLKNLRGGEIVEVINAGGETLRFRVETVETYPRDSVPTERLFADTNTARLNLITCTGEWVPEEETYADRLVVYAVLI